MHLVSVWSPPKRRKGSYWVTEYKLYGSLGDWWAEIGDAHIEILTRTFEYTSSGAPRVCMAVDLFWHAITFNKYQGK